MSFLSGISTKYFGSTTSMHEQREGQEENSAEGQRVSGPMSAAASARSSRVVATTFVKTARPPHRGVD